MAKGDKFIGGNTVAVGSSLTIQPSGSTEATIMNISSNKAYTVKSVYSGTEVVRFQQPDASGGPANGYCFNTTNSYYLVVSNDDPSSQSIIHFDGVYTKV